MKSTALALLAALLLTPLAGIAADSEQAPDFAATLVSAKARNAPVLLDFHAPWCHSCYYMEKHVLTGPEWQTFTKKSLVLPLDTDTPEGAALKARYKLLGVPTYVLVDANGKELGRIVGDMPRSQFYKELSRISQKGGGLEALQAKTLVGGKAGNAAALAALKSYRAAIDGSGGVQWWGSLPEARRAALEAQPRIANELAWLRLIAAAEGKTPDAAACARMAPPLLAQGQNSCTFAANLSTVNGCVEGLPEAERRAFLAPYRAPLEALVRAKVIANPPRCSDNRDPVALAVELAELDGQPEAGKALLNEAIAHGQVQLQKGVARDKSIADNQRVFLEQAGRWDELDTLLQQLVAAYPDDYVYANRYARALAARKQHEKALPWFAKAAEKAYGVNRLRNAQEQVKSLLALGQKEQAQQLVAEVLSSNGPWFEEDVAKLKGLLG